MTKSQEIFELTEMLPPKEQGLAYEFIKRMVLAWDPDYTRLTPVERIRLDEAERQIKQGETISHYEIDWD
jgi:hypothetical protein